MPERNSEWHTIQTAAAKSGLSVDTVRRAIAAGFLPAYRPPGTSIIRIRASDFDQWVSTPLPVQVP